jgi:hypothetical protein
LGDDVSKARRAGDRAISLSIPNSSIIVHGFTASLKDQWADYDSQIPHDTLADQALEGPANTEKMKREQVHGGKMDIEQETEDLDDRESLDLVEMENNSIYRFVRNRLARYYVSCRVVTRFPCSLGC